MASFQTLKNGHTKAYVRKAGHKTETKTFRLYGDATRWAADRERAITAGPTTHFGELRSTMVADILRRFDEEVAPTRKGWRWEHNRIQAFMREPWAFLNLTQDIALALQVWRDKRCREVLGQTVGRDFNLLGSIFTHAIKEWRLTIQNPVHQVKRPKTQGGERNVTWSDEDLQLFLDHFKFDPDARPVTSTDFVPWVLLIARHTGLRLGNVHDIRLKREMSGAGPGAVPYPWLDLSVPCIHYPKEFTKAVVDYPCPLSKAAVALLSKLAAHRAGKSRLIEPNKGSLGTLFRQHREVIARTHPHVRGLRIHDQRHTWTTEVVPKLVAKGHDDLMLAKITGRRSTKSLFRYFNPGAATMAAALD